MPNVDLTALLDASEHNVKLPCTPPEYEGDVFSYEPLVIPRTMRVAWQQAVAVWLEQRRLDDALERLDAQLLAVKALRGVKPSVTDDDLGLDF